MNVTNTGIWDKSPYAEYEATVSQNEEHKPKRARVAEPEIPQPQDIEYQGKHIAQRSVAKWNSLYGDPKIWDDMFEYAVVNATKKLKSGEMGSRELVTYLSDLRGTIAAVQKNSAANKFGQKRVENTCTLIRKNNIYGYALDRAVNINYDENFSAECIYNIIKWLGKALGPFTKGFRYGVVLGSIKGETISLTQYIYCPFSHFDVLKKVFGYEPDNYVLGIASRPESVVWLHTDPKKINKVMEHIYSLVDKALTGDLTTIPRIHWWYVHLSPDCRGSGGIAEMITNTLCRLHGYDLPAWNQGIAPSVEVLLEPNEEKFCENYHKLFACGHDDLRKIFTDTSDEDS